MKFNHADTSANPDTFQTITDRLTLDDGTPMILSLEYAIQKRIDEYRKENAREPYWCTEKKDFKALLEPTMHSVRSILNRAKVFRIRSRKQPDCIQMRTVDVSRFKAALFELQKEFS